MNDALRFWGITGTNGKTTSTWIAASFMRAAYITTVEAWTGLRRFYTGYTTPPLAMLRGIYDEMRASGMHDCVMEVSSHAIHQNRVDFGETTVFSGGAFTNLSEDHLDYHQTMAEYFQVKLSFAARLAGTAREKGFAPCPYVVCLDGEGGREMYEACGKIEGLDLIPVSIDPACPEVVRYRAKGARCAARPYDLSGLRLAGEYNKSNVLVAAALAEAAGVGHETIQQAIPTLRPRWGRLEEVDTACPARVFIDFAHTPDGLEKVLTAARAFTPGRLWVVFGAGGNRDTAKRPRMGEVCERLADAVLVTSDNPRGEEPVDIIRDILAGMKSPSRARVEPDRKKAICLALDGAQEGDTVLICGKGHEKTQEVKDFKYPFDDSEVARQYVRGAGQERAQT